MTKENGKEYNVKVRLNQTVSVDLRIPAEMRAFELYELVKVVEDFSKVAPIRKEKERPKKNETADPKPKKQKPKKQKEEDAKSGEWSEYEDRVIFDNWDKSKTKSRNFYDISKLIDRNASQVMQHVYYWKRNHANKYKKLTGE